MTKDKRKSVFLQEYEKHKKAKEEGYAGILPNGRLVDRREYPDAIPLPENKLLKIPKPKLLYLTKTK